MERFRSRDMERFLSRDLERFRSRERDLSRRPRDLDLLSRERDLLRPLSLGDLTGDFDSFLTSLSSLGLATSVRMYIPEKSSPVFSTPVIDFSNFLPRLLFKHSTFSKMAKLSGHTGGEQQCCSSIQPCFPPFLEPIWRLQTVGTTTTQAF
jgi:hypothetical protein